MFVDNPFGGAFDFNRDGKEDLAELWVAYKIYEECTKEEEEESGYTYSSHHYYRSFFDDDDDEDVIDTSWRYLCEDGSEFDLDPEDYETEEEYNEALADAKEKVAWRDFCEDGSEFDLDPEDYETEEEYNDALRQARTAWRGACEDGSKYGLDPEDYETEEEYNDALQQAQTAWLDTCEDSSEFDLDPVDYETEEEYNAALQKARTAWRDTCEDGRKYGLDPENFETEEQYNEALEKAKEESYPNKRRFNAAYALANDYFFCSDKEVERREKACCQFIIDNADKITAANYISYKGGFLYAQAIKDNFQLPVSLPDEDEFREYELSETLCKIAKRNTALSFEVWEWALATFLPYIQYADGSLSELTSSVIDGLYNFPKGYKTELARYMDKHPGFIEKVLDERAEISSDLDELIVAALQDGLMDTALVLFKHGLVQAGDDWKKINSLTGGTISYCKTYDELESAEYFKLNMLPLVKAIDIGMVQNEIEKWEKDLDEYINCVENDCEQYAYTRKNAWRKNVPDGKKYGLDPCNYDSEQEYMEVLNEEKYGWRKWYRDDDTLGLNVDDFETHEEYKKAYDARRNEKRQKEREQREQERQQRREKEQCIETEKAREDDKIYTFCGVMFPHALRPYNYRTEDPTIKIGDDVLVPVGDREAIGTVVSVGQYMRIAAPYPVDKTKFIIRKVEEKAAR